MARAATTSDSHFDPPRADMGAHWGWFVALGIALLIFGALALGNLVAATIASVLFVGALMIVGGIAQIVAAFRLRRWGGFFFWLISGVLYTGAGVLAFYNPMLAAQALTLLLALSLIVSGLFRIGSGMRSHPTGGWGWIVASGVVSILVGMIVVAGWPVNSLFMLGIVLAVDLTFQGVADIVFGIAIKSRRSALA